MCRFVEKEMSLSAYRGPVAFTCKEAQLNLMYQARLGWGRQQWSRDSLPQMHIAHGGL